MAGKENREIKNSVFVDLFYEDESAEKNEIALYNALHKEPLPEGTTVEKIRVEDVLYMNFKNDIAFGVLGKVMVLGEHQSTINANMPLRCLLYVGRTYEKLVPVEKRYRKAQVQLPKPEFYTFYNGKEKWEKDIVLKLSDAYEIKEGNPLLELEVRVININPQEHHEVLEKCQVLKEYSQFTSTVARYKEQGVPDALRCAISECIDKGILAEYLRRKGSEVRNMLTAEYDYEMDMAVCKEEACEELNGLIQSLIEEGRMEELKRSVKDREFQKELLREYRKKQWLISHK